MEIKDFTKELRLRLYERVSSPLYSTFIVSWCITNWRFLYVTFIETYQSLGMSKMEYIGHALYPYYCWCTYMKLIIIPSISTGIIIWILPKLVNAAYKVSEEYKTKRREDRLTIMGTSQVEGSTLLDAMKQLQDKESEYAQIVAEKKETDKAISKLQLKLNLSETSLRNREAEIKDFNSLIIERDRKISKLELVIKGYRHNLSDLFKGTWICRSNQKNEWESEYFMIRDNKYLSARHDNPNGFGEKYSIDEVVLDDMGGEYIFRKIPLNMGEISGRPIKVRLQKSNDNLYVGTEDNLPVKYEFFR